MEGFLIPTSATVIRPDASVDHIYEAEALTEPVAWIPAGEARPGSATLKASGRTRPTTVPSLNDEGLRERVLQEAMQAQAARHDDLRRKARGKWAQQEHERRIKSERRARSSVFLAPERGATRYTKTDLMRPVNDSELMLTPKLDFVRPRSPQVILRRRIESPSTPGSAEPTQQKRVSSTRSSTHASVRTRAATGKSGEALPGSGPGPTEKPPRPSSCFLTPGRDQYVSPLAFRMNKPAAELQGRKPTIRPRPQGKVAPDTSEEVKDSTEPAEPIRSKVSTNASAVTGLEGRPTSASGRAKLMIEDMELPVQGPVQRVRSRPATADTPTHLNAQPVRTVASRAQANHAYVRNQRSISPWRDWRIKDGAAAAEPTEKAQYALRGRAQAQTRASDDLPLGDLTRSEVQAMATRHRRVAPLPTYAPTGPKVGPTAPTSGQTRARATTQPDRKLVAAIRQERVRKTSIHRGKDPASAYTPSRRLQRLQEKADKTAFRAGTRGGCVSEPASPGIQRTPRNSDAVRQSIDERLKYQNAAYLPDYRTCLGRSSLPRSRSECGLTPLQQADSRPASTPARGGLDHRDMQGMLYTQQGLPVPASLAYMLTDNVLGTVKEIQPGGGHEPQDGPLLAVRDEPVISRRFSPARPVSVNDLKRRHGGFPAMQKQISRSKPQSQQGLRYDSHLSPNAFTRPSDEPPTCVPDAQATIAETNIERRRYNLTHPSVPLASKMPVTGREIMPGKMAPYCITNLNVPTATLLVKTIQAGEELCRPVISTSHFDYSEQLDVTDAGNYIRPRVRGPTFREDYSTSANLDTGRLAVDSRIALLDKEYMESSKFYDRKHIDECYKHKAGAPAFATQTRRRMEARPTVDVFYKVNYSAVDPRIPSGLAIEKQQCRFK
ncbi:hypothetical protein GMRT_10526 [Giardia muris]|uniref:Uncharacterized protein n=1 Tax=Giardia muris TaxID=5742 RepID=A0A4Z1SMH8_GIAMU|nr:hypothetical protein GMRT_10526 [Giardia muris]|eukprot:TNJ26894.1 hypothetical protein GMRT_10526 [Giardia muris]